MSAGKLLRIEAKIPLAHTQSLISWSRCHKGLPLRAAKLSYWSCSLSLFQNLLAPISRWWHREEISLMQSPWDMPTQRLVKHFLCLSQRAGLRVIVN